MRPSPTRSKGEYSDRLEPRSKLVFGDGTRHQPYLITMTLPCFLLGKFSPSYIYTGAYQVEDDATVHSVTQDSRMLASVYHEWELTGVEIKLYKVSSNLAFHWYSKLPLTPPQPDQPFGVTKNKTRADLKNLLLDSVNDEYLRLECSRVLPSTGFGSPGCIIAVGWSILVSSGPWEH